MNKDKAVTIEQVIAWKPCGLRKNDNGRNYTPAYIKRLFDGRDSLTADDIKALGIPGADISWALKHLGETVGAGDDPIMLEFLEGGEVIVNIDTTEFIHVMFDTADETAMAIERLLHWTHDWIQGEREGWMRTEELFKKEIWKILDHVYARKDEVLVFRRAAYIKETGISDGQYYEYQVSDEQWDLLSDGDEYANAAARAFPVAAIKALHEAQMSEPDWVRSICTANEETDLDREWVAGIFLEDYYNGLYAIIDYNAVALVRDPDYIYDWIASPCCQGCGEGWDNMYWWGKDFKKNHTKIHHDPTGKWGVRAWMGMSSMGFPTRPIEIEVDDRDIELAAGFGIPDSGIINRGSLQVWRKTTTRRESLPPATPPSPNRLAIELVTQAQVSNGQMSLPGVEYEWPFDVSPADAQALVRHYKEFIDWGEEDEQDYTHPTALIDGEGDAVSYPPLDVNSGPTPASTARLLCPHCGTYSVGLSNPVYGY